ncbi:MAG: hypothetical protein ACT4NL_07285 [Pseudomarimonas sp.]
MTRFLVCGLALFASAAQGQQVAPRLGDFYSSATISETAYAADDSLLVGGLFDRVGTTNRRNLVRFAPDGTLDTAWAPDPDGLIRGIVFDPAGNIYVVGNFKTIAGVARPGVAKFLAGNPYVLDTSYLPDVPISASTVDAIARRSDGSVYVSYCVQTPTFSCKVVRLDAQGAAISSFDVTTNGAVFPIALSQDEQSVLIAGAVTSVGGVTIPSRANLAKLDANTGAMSLGWIPFATGNGSVRAMVADGPGHMVAAGQIPGGADGLARIALADPGTADVGFGPDLGPATSILLTELARMPDNDLFISGNFTLIDGQTRDSRVAKLAPDGTARPGWGVTTPLGGNGSNTFAVSLTGRVAKPSLGLAGGIARTTMYELSSVDGSDLGELVSANFSALAAFRQIVREPVTGRIFAGASGLEDINGRFSHAVFAFQPNLQPDLGWTSMLGSKARMGGNLYFGTGPTTMILGGFGFGTNSLQVAGLYRLNAVDGSNNNWFPQASAGVGLGINAPSAVAVDEAGGFAYTVGINTDANGAGMPGGTFRRFALADGLRDSTWLSTLSIAAGAPPMLVADGFVYLGNLNSTTATDNSTVIGLARYAVSGIGRADPNFKPFQAITNIQAMAHDFNHIYVGGSAILARISLLTGLIDPSWRPTTATNIGTVNSISVADDGSVLVAGSVNLGCGGTPVSVARIQSGGNVDPTWGVSLDGPANSVLAIPPADALIGGGFRTANGAAHDGLVRLGRSDTVFIDGLGDPTCVR